MRPTFMIAWREFRSLFFSPVGWILLALFIGVTSMQLTTMMDSVGAFQWRAGQGPTVTQWLLIFPGSGVFVSIRDQLPYFVPLLTMGVFARERASGAWMLPASSPLSLIEIVLGKYFSLAFYFFVFMAYLFVLSVISAVFVPSLDWGYVIASLSGLYLLSLAYAAIGVFFSALTSYQIVAGIVTVAVLFLLNLIGQVGQEIPIVADVTYWLAMAGRADWMLSGLISSSDVFYFLIIIALFLLLTYLHLVSGRSTAVRWVRLTKQASVVAAGLALGALSSVPHLSVHADMTREKTLTLAQESQSIVASLDGPLQLTAYINVLENRSNRYMPQNRRTTERFTFSKYSRQKQNLSVRYVYYYAPTSNSTYISRFKQERTLEELAQDWAYQHGVSFRRVLSPDEIADIPGLREADHRPVYVARWKDRSQPISTFEDLIHYPEEDTISAALKLLVEPARQIAFTAGNGERSAFTLGNRHYASLFGNYASRNALVHRGFDVKEVDPEEPLPEGIDNLIIASPSQVYSINALTNLRAYIARGGDLVILADPEAREPLDPILDMIGVELEPGPFATEGLENADAVVFTRLTEDARAIYDTPSGLDFSRVPLVMSEAVAVKELPHARTEGFKVTRLMAFADRLDMSAAFSLERDVQGQTQKVLVIGDGDFLAQGLLSSREYEHRNPAFFIGALRWLNEGVLPGAYAHPEAIDRELTATSDQIRTLRRVLQWGLPLLILLAGAAFLLLRRRA